MRTDRHTTTPADAASYEAHRAADNGPWPDAPDAGELAQAGQDLDRIRENRAAHDARRARALAAGRWHPTWADQTIADEAASLIRLDAVMRAHRLTCSATVVRDGVIQIGFPTEATDAMLERAAAGLRDRNAAAPFAHTTYDVVVNGRVVWVRITRAPQPAAPF